MAIIATPASHQRRHDVDGGRIWLLEHSPLEAEMARRAIAADHAVEIFLDSPALLERIASGSRPDILVLHCERPTATGLALCRVLRASFDKMDLPILLLTMQGDRSDIVDGLHAGANDCLAKPYDVAELLARVGTLVRTRALHRARVRRARDVALTAEVGDVLTGGLDSPAQSCVEAIGRHLDADFASIWTAEGDGHLAIRAIFGVRPAGCMAAPRKGRDRLVSFDEETDGMVDDERWRAERARTFVAAPLIVESRVVGVLTIGLTRHPDPEELDVLTPLANLMALDLERTWVEREHSAAVVRERRAREEAEAGNRIRDEFLAILSHELRGPLNAISGWVRMLRSGMVPAAGMDRALATIERNTVAQSQLVEDLLDVSRIVSGRLTIDSVLVDLAEAVEGVVDSLRPVAVEKKLTLVTRIDPTGNVRGDPARLRQVATNLVSNALKFTPVGGRVTVSVHGQGHVAVLCVEDTGQGIEANFLPHVFERFRQADGSTARRHSGLGLGLAIVHHIAQLHGGSVDAASDGLGRGASFTLKIPLAAGESSAPSSATRSIDPPSAECTDLRVVVVDDEPDARELVARILGDRGADVRMAGCADEALAMVGADPPDVIVTDLGMPGESGYELLTKLRALPPARGGMVPAIALTAYGHPGHRELAMRAGFDQFLTKPVDFDAIVAAVARLGRSPPRRA